MHGQQNIKICRLCCAERQSKDEAQYSRPPLILHCLSW